MDKRLLDILCCPVSKTPVRPLNASELNAVNRAIEGCQVLSVAGATVHHRLAEGLITVDSKLIYRIEDGIPVMLPEEGIGTTQFTDFPAAS
ncbi:MAG TPA: Trm112 family protein [Dyella sp.]|nr:Trm112 family protein [Dyella sp.]